MYAVSPRKRAPVTQTSARNYSVGRDNREKSVMSAGTKMNDDNTMVLSQKQHAKARSSLMTPQENS